MAKSQNGKCTVEVFAKSAALHTKLLRSILLADSLEFRCELVIILGEQPSHPARDMWRDRIVTQPDYAGVISFRPWETDRELQLTAPTAIECCEMLTRAIYAALFKEMPILWGITRPIPEAHAAMEEYCRNNFETLRSRLDIVVKELNFSEWARVIALAEVERARLLAGAIDEDNVSRTRGNWADDPSERPLDYAHGPLTGQLKDLAKWMDLDGRTIGKHVCKPSGSYWGATVPEGYSIWFRHEPTFTKANKMKTPTPRNRTPNAR